VSGPPGNGKGALLHAPIPKLRLRTAYRIAAFLATAFGRPFWFWEQWRGRLMDRIDNEREDE
jgi:hypothetical protein